MKPLKVYNVNYNGRESRMVAATSRAEAGRLMGVSAYTMASYCSVTGNKEQIELAMREPGKVWRQSYKMGSVWEEVS